MVELEPGERLTPPRFARAVGVGSQDEAPFYFGHVRLGGTTVPVWIVSPRSGADPGEAREVRMCLLRIHSEFETLRTVLRNVASERLRVLAGSAASDELQRYLRSAIRYLFAPSQAQVSYGATITHEAVLDAAYRYYDLVLPGERESLLDSLRSVRPNVYKMVSALLDEQQGRRAPVISIDNSQVAIVGGGEEPITMNKINIGGNATNVNIAIADSITDSFNAVAASKAPDQIKEVLRTLSEQVKELAAKAPGDAAAEAAAHLQTINAQATLPKPNKSLLDISAAGLKEAAEAVKDVAAPIAATLGTLFSVLNLGGL